MHSSFVQKFSWNHPNMAHNVLPSTAMVEPDTVHVTPGYSGQWPGDSGREVSISIIWSSGPHNHLNRKYHSLSLTPTLSRDLSLPHLPHELSLSPSSRFRNLSFQLDSKAERASLDVGDHLLQVFHLGTTSFRVFLQEKLAQGTRS